MSDSGIVLTTLDLGLAGVEVQRLLQARTEGLRQSQQNHVEVKLIQALLVLCAVDGAQVGLNANAGKVFGKGLKNPLEVRVDQQDFETEWLSLAVQQALPGRLPAGAGQ
ncbi:hypothetical protein D9M68_828850 [compost metagenome]